MIHFVVPTVAYRATVVTQCDVSCQALPWSSIHFIPTQRCELNSFVLPSFELFYRMLRSSIEGARSALRNHGLKASGHAMPPLGALAGDSDQPGLIRFLVVQVHQFCVCGKPTG